MRVYVEVTLEEGLYPIVLSPKGIGGRVCRRLHRNMFVSATNVKDTILTSINQGGGGGLNPLTSP